jgi:large subunit ribosomal protein L19
LIKPRTLKKAKESEETGTPAQSHKGESMNIIDEIEAEQKRDIIELKPGQRVRVHVRVAEGEKERVQVFEGVVIGLSGEGTRRTFTVRKISYGVGVERIFPIYSPRIDKVEVVAAGRVRRAKLYYLRQLSGRRARLEEDRRPRAS